MFLTLVAAWHGGLTVGFAGQFKKNKPYMDVLLEGIGSLTIGAEAGKRFFINQSRWFIDPTLNISTITIFPAIQGEARIGATFGPRLALYAIAGIGGMTVPGTKQYLYSVHSIEGLGFSWGLVPNASLTIRVAHKWYMYVNSKGQFSALAQKDAHHLFATLGIEIHQSSFYKG